MAGRGAAAVPWAPQERTELAVDYLGVPIGKARIQVGSPEGRVLPVFLEARTSGVGSLLDIREQLASYLDVETGLPSWTTLHAVEPGYRHHDRADFDREAGVATVREVGTREKVTKVKVPPGTLDFVGLVFALRTLPLPQGQRHAFPVLAGTTVLQVTAEVVGREAVRTGAGTFQAIKVRVPTGFTGKFSERDPTYLWLSDDQRRIPVRIVTEFRVGRATAELTRYTPGRAAAAPAGGPDQAGGAPGPGR